MNTFDSAGVLALIIAPLLREFHVGRTVIHRQATGMAGGVSDANSDARVSEGTRPRASSWPVFGARRSCLRHATDPGVEVPRTSSRENENEDGISALVNRAAGGRPTLRGLRP